MSEHKQQAAERRDFRHTHGDPETPRSRGKRNKSLVECKRSPDEMHSFIESDTLCGDGYWSRWREFRCEFCNIQEFSAPRNWLSNAS